MSESEFGFYGKIPHKGDFVSRDLSPIFIQFWDTWLQSVLQASREELKEEWLNTFLNSPVWRFVISAGQIDDQAWAGLIMPSVD